MHQTSWYETTYTRRQNTEATPEEWKLERRHPTIAFHNAHADQQHQAESETALQKTATNEGAGCLCATSTQASVEN